MSLADLKSLARELVLAERQLAGQGATVEQFTVDGFVGAHVEQRRFVLDDSQWQHVMCARQSGKTVGDYGKLHRNSLRNRRSVNVFLGLKGTAVRENVWEPIVKPMMWRFGVPKRCLNETRMSCHLDNGSRILFGGTSDFSHIKNQLGKRLAKGMFIIDESQDQPDKVLSPLIDHVLPPMLTPETQVVLSGVIPDVPAGRFYREAQAKRWSKHNWGRFANVHTPEAREQFAKYVEAIGMAVAWRMSLELTTPEKRAEFDEYLTSNGLLAFWAIIQRDWFGVATFDPAATAFRYVEARNSYDGHRVDAQRFVGAVPADILAKLTNISVGIDPGAYDRCAIVVTGWGRGTGLWVLEEWVTARNSGTLWSDVGNELKRIRREYAINEDTRRSFQIFADFSGSKMTLDVFSRDFGIPAVLAAKKSERRWQVDRCNDLLMEAEAWIPKGSALGEDLTKAQWDKDARSRGEFEWSSVIHPDVADAFRYASHPYLELAVSAKTVEDKNPSIKKRLARMKAERESGYFDGRRKELAQ